MGRLPRTVAATAVALVAATLAMGPAPVSAAGGGLATASGEHLQYTAAAGDANDIAVTFSLSYWVGDFLHTYANIDDNATIRAGSGCSYLSPNDHTIVQCHLVVPRYGSSMATIRGGDRNDIIRNHAAIHLGVVRMYGGPGDDRIYGDVHLDLLWGDAGNDRLYGGRGMDGVYGGPGKDLMYGGGQYDTMYGNTGNDTMDGGTDIDYMYGGSGVDIMSGRTGNDVMNGGGGNDTMYGNEDRDNLDGGDGTDRLNGGAPNAAPGDRCVNGPILTQCNP